MMVINLKVLFYISLIFCFATAGQADDTAHIPSDYSVPYQRPLSSEVEDRADKLPDRQAIIREFRQQMQRHTETAQRHTEIALGCIKMQPRSKKPHPNNIPQLIEELYDHIYIINKGAIKMGEQFPLTPYYDPNITILDLHDQLFEVGFRVGNVKLGEGCLCSDSLESVPMCKNIDLCRSCEFEITYLYDELRDNYWFSLGYPIYQIIIISKGGDFEGITQLNARK